MDGSFVELHSVLVVVVLYVGRMLYFYMEQSELHDMAITRQRTHSIHTVYTHKATPLSPIPVVVVVQHQVTSQQP